MFSRTTANFIHRTDKGGSLIPVAHLNDSAKLVPMAMVVKKGRQWWQSPKYQPSAFTLVDILKTKLPLSPGISDSDFGSYNGEVVKKGRLSAIGVIGGKVKRQTTYNLGNLKKETVDVRNLHSESSEGKVDMQHVLVKRLKKGDVLAFLTERIVTTGTSHLTEKRSNEGNVEVSANTVPVCSQVFKADDCVDGLVQFDRNDSMDIPPGTVIAYSLEELKIQQQNGCFDWYDADGGIESDAFHFEEGLVPDSTALQELPQETRSALFERFCELMEDRNALSDVENTLEEWCAGDGTVETGQNASVYHNKSASAILDLLRHSDGTSGGPLTAVHLLVSAMEELPDEALILLSEYSKSPDVLEAFNELLIMLDLKDQQKSCSSLPMESLPLPLRDDTAFLWVQELLITSKVILRKEAEKLLAKRESDAGMLPLVLCVTVQGFSYLCNQQN